MRNLSEHEALQRLYPMADAVQFSLFLCSEPKTKAWYVKGHGEFDAPLNKDRQLTFKVKVIGSNLDEDGSYLVLEVLGDLWALLSYDNKLQELTFGLLNSGKHGPDLRKNTDLLTGHPVKDIWRLLTPVLVASWWRGERDEKWRSLDEIAVVDQGVEEPQEQRRGVDTPVAGPA